jgi:hypothetical protein
MNEPTRPPRRGSLRTLVIVVIAGAGALVGGLLDLIFAVATEGPTIPVLTIGFGLIGLLIGLVVAIMVFPNQRPPRPTRPFDPARYPNRVIGKR